MKHFYEISELEQQRQQLGKLYLEFLRVPSMSAGVWYHVAVTLNGNTGILYLNGAPVGTNNTMTLRPSSLGNTANNYLGKSQYPDPYLNGVLDEFRIYSVTLSRAEIAATSAFAATSASAASSPPTTATRVFSNTAMPRVIGKGWSG